MKVFIVTDLGFGDGGKGSVVDMLCDHTGAELVVRHNGGAQAAHNVVTPDGRKHTFAQLGSGSFLPNRRTLLSRYMLVNPLSFMTEQDAFMRNGGDVFPGQVCVDERAIITTPYHIALNRARERARGVERHGTTGMGIGETVMDYHTRGSSVLFVRDLLEHQTHILKKLMAMRDALLPAMQRLGADDDFRRVDMVKVMKWFHRFTTTVSILNADKVTTLLQSSNGIVFEGAQGIMLDEDFGFHPHTTWSKTTSENADKILHEADVYNSAEIRRVGVTRTYCTRHGAGPFPTEQYNLHYPEPANGNDGLAGTFRQGWLDLHMLQYAINCNHGIDRLVVNHADLTPHLYLPKDRPLFNMTVPTSLHEQEILCRRAWDRVPDKYYALAPDNFSVFIAEELGVPLLAIGRGVSRDCKEIMEL